MPLRSSTPTCRTRPPSATTSPTGRGCTARWSPPTSTSLQEFQAELRPVFEASDDDDVPLLVSELNELLARHPVTPMISDHDPEHLHMHVANSAASVAELLVGEALMGLANLVCDLGATRLGTCSEPRCDNVYVDTSPNQSRRYCSDRCSSRANVAAFRARQKAATAS